MRGVMTCQRRRRPGNVGEVADDGARPAPDEGRRQVQVVVVHHDARLRVVAGLGQRGARKCLVDGDVAVVPGAQRGGVDHRPAGQLPHLVLQEPERRVGDDPVGGLVLRPLDRREAQADLARQRLVDEDGRLMPSRSPSLNGASQVSGTCRPTCDRAVTRPPLPRRGRRPPSAPMLKVTGPRLVAISSRRSPSRRRAAPASRRSHAAVGSWAQKRAPADSRSRPRIGSGKMPSSSTPATDSASAALTNGWRSMGAGSASGSRMYM